MIAALILAVIAMAAVALWLASEFRCAEQAQEIRELRRVKDEEAKHLIGIGMAAARQEDAQPHTDAVATTFADGTTETGWGGHGGERPTNVHNFPITNVNQIH